MTTKESELRQMAAAMENGCEEIIKIVKLYITMGGDDIDQASLEMWLRSEADRVKKTDKAHDDEMFASVMLLVCLMQMEKGMAGVEYWETAIQNVCRLKKDMGGEDAPRFLQLAGLDEFLDMFYNSLMTSIQMSGLLYDDYVPREDTANLAKGLIINWGIRYLIARALEVDPEEDPDEIKQDFRFLSPLKHKSWWMIWHIGLFYKRHYG